MNWDNRELCDFKSVIELTDIFKKRLCQLVWFIKRNIDCERKRWQVNIY